MISQTYTPKQRRTRAVPLSLYLMGALSLVLQVALWGLVLWALAVLPLISSHP